MLKKLLALALLSPFMLAAQQKSCDVLIVNGKIIDGTGNSWYYGDIAVKGGKIVDIGKLAASYTASKTIDAKKMIVSPGFIDVHGHIESILRNNPTAENYIYDGVTTVITGNCGGSADDIGGFLGEINEKGTSINVASLIGHNNVRRMIMNRDNRYATPEEQLKMDALIEKGMKDGALGMSTGLIYIPGAYSNTEEVVSLAKATAKHGGVYVSHIRNEEGGVIDAVNEAIHIGRAANIPVQISHYKVSGKVNWGKSKTTIKMIEDARKEGFDVTIDQYPYTASSTNLGVRLPDWSLAGGQDSIVARLNDAPTRARIKKEMLAQLAGYGYKNYSYAVVANYSADTSFNGKSITEINKSLGRKSNAATEAETIMEMIAKGGAQMVYHQMNENDIKYIMSYPYSMFGADAGVPVMGVSRPHPRGYGTNARVLGKYVREENVISLEEAIRRMSSLAAQKFYLKDRGLLKEGYAADILIFDENEVADKATFDQPHQYSVGFKYVLVNGDVVMDEAKHTGKKSGKALYGPAKE
ncbi:N-acyl-D-amino-acid deacylase family protein [Gynurincola endophyticus]|uniref:N-acyl-D-amino-acid deacylase family protein n=1 Tax=Gynurincola endophyticus TaxID=2479004 RepID=UPI000F8D6B53|nr:D-aminoacylase [Gynurincola endophyticus]